MNWIKSLQNAINFIEDNLMEELDYSEIAKQANSSSFHFQRIFSILCGYSLGEYIRNRRLSLAGNELATTEQKVIDVALKYGYESPESFSRAFVRFHGITPSEIKTQGGNLKSFSKLSVKLILDGGCVMDYRIEKHDEFKLISKKEFFPEDMEKAQKLIPEFWTKTRPEIHKILKYLKKDKDFGDVVIGACFEEETKDGFFPYGIGVLYNGAKVEDDLVIDTIPAATWAKFNCIGPMPIAIQSLLNKIYSEFFPSSEYKPVGGYYFELYPDGNTLASDYECEIWISVEKK